MNTLCFIVHPCEIILPLSSFVLMSSHLLLSLVMDDALRLASASYAIMFLCFHSQVVCLRQSPTAWNG